MKSTFLNQCGDNINKIASMHGVRSIRVFGSFARGDENTTSDIDLLIELDPKRSLLDIIALKYEIQDLTGRKVDVVTTKGISLPGRADTEGSSITMRTDHVYLCHILDSIAKIESYATVGKDETKNRIAYAGGCRICAKCNDNVYTKGYA